MIGIDLGPWFAIAVFGVLAVIVLAVFGAIVLISSFFRAWYVSLLLLLLVVIVLTVNSVELLAFFSLPLMLAGFLPLYTWTQRAEGTPDLPDAARRGLRRFGLGTLGVAALIALILFIWSRFQ